MMKRNVTSGATSQRKPKAIINSETHVFHLKKIKAALKCKRSDTHQQRKGGFSSI